MIVLHETNMFANKYKYQCEKQIWSFSHFGGTSYPTIEKSKHGVSPTLAGQAIRPLEIILFADEH